MKTTLLSLSFIFAAFFFSHSQTIEYTKGFGGYTFTQNGEKISPEVLTTQLNTNEESAQLLKKAKNQGILSSIIGGAGGALVGYPIGTAIGGGEANWALAGVGAGIIAIGIPFSISANSKTRKAIEVYNAGITPGEENLTYKPQLIMVSNSTGMGLALKF